MTYTLRDHGHAFFECSTQEAVETHIESLKSQSAEQLGYQRLDGDEGVEVQYHVFLNDELVETVEFFAPYDPR
jgi:hypothetical protein